MTNAIITRTFHEVSEAQRNAFAGAIAIPGTGETATKPACYVKAFNLEAEYELGNSVEMVRRMFSKDRNCPKWYPYTPGFTPKEHLEQQRSEQAESSRGEFEQRLENSRRRFEIKITLFSPS